MDSESYEQFIVAEASLAEELPYIGEDWRG
ncbi:MAG TPA: hypothetical protein VGB35_01885 [Gammaproteobacteria bacterium]